MKKWLVLLMTAACTGLVNGQGVERAWHYDGVIGPENLNGPSAGNNSTGTLAGVKWGSRTGFQVVNEMIKVERTGSNNGGFANVALSGLATGTFEFKYDIVSADFSNTLATTNSCNVGFVVRGGGSGTFDHGLRLRVEGRLNVTNVTDGVTNIIANADQLQVEMKDATTGGGFNVVTNFGQGVTSIADLNLRCVYDLDAGTIDAYITHASINGGVELLVRSGTLAAGFTWANARMITQFKPDPSSSDPVQAALEWQPGDITYIDNLVYSAFAAAPPLPDDAIIDLWTYDEADGTAFSGAVSTGYVGGAAFSDSPLAVVSNQMLRWTHDGVTASAFKSGNITGGWAGSTTGKYEYAVDYAAADFTTTDASNALANAGFYLRDTVAGNVYVGLRLQFNGPNDEFRLQYRDPVASSFVTLKTFPGNVLSNLNTRIEVDLDSSGASGSVRAFYALNGGPEIGLFYDGTLSSGFTLSEHRVIVQTTNGGTGWQPGDELWVDNLKLSAIPSMTDAPVFGAPVVEYLMDDTAGTLIQDLAQTGSDSGHLPGDDPAIVTDGGGNLVWSVITNTAFRTHSMSTTFTEGIHRVDVVYADWDFTSSSNGSAVKVGLYDESGTNGVTVGIDALPNPDNTNATPGVRVRAATADGTGGGQYILPGFSTGTGIVVRLEINLDGGFFDAYWRYSTDVDFSALAGGEPLGGLANIQKFKLNTTDNIWGPSDFVKMDSVTYTTTSAEQPWTPEARWEQWLAQYPGLGASTNETDNPDGDAYINVYEYGLGGDPTAANTAHEPQFGELTEDGGTNYIRYVYARLKDNASANRGLSYFLQTKTDLIFGTWTNAFYEVEGVGSLDAEFNAVTNRISTDAGDQRFIRLKIDLNL
jgi:hypothetical protein